MTDLEFTGERYIRGRGGPQIAYEHLHRYLFAARWARGRIALDVAAGSGYGTAILAKFARQVWALDLDQSSLHHARSIAKSPNADFLQADATCLPFRDRSIELIVAMEVLEHVTDQEGLIRELARVALPGAPVLISTPNRASYSDARVYSNPFHVREYYRDELVAALSKHFRHVRLMQQQVRAGSLIEGGFESAESEVLVDPVPDDRMAPTEPMYFLALCSVEEPCEDLPAKSAYLDITDAFFLEWKERLEGALDEVRRLNAEIRKLGSWSRDLEQRLEEKEEALRSAMESFAVEIGDRDHTIRSLQEEMLSEIGHRDRELVQLRREFEERSRWALELQGDVQARDQRLRAAMENLDAMGAELHRIRSAFMYRLLCRLRILQR